MALKSIQSWTYFCGANAKIKLGERVIGEAVAIQYKLFQNRTPLYGYNAPLFNAVADGQVLVQGTIAINYVSHEYLLAAIKSNASIDPEILKIFQPQKQEEIILDEDSGTYMVTDDLTSEASDYKSLEALRQKYWSPNSSSSDYNFDISEKGKFGRPDQFHKSLSITVEYGDTNKISSTRHIIKDVFFLGRAMGTSITEDPQVEQFDFIARNII